MNELIERLAREAGMFHRADDDEWNSDQMDGVSHECLTRFAALVAGEAAKVCDEEAADFKRTGQGAYDGRYESMADGSLQCADAIRAKFKV